MLRVARAFRTHAALAFGAGTLCLAFAAASKSPVLPVDRNVRDYGYCTLHSTTSTIDLRLPDFGGRRPSHRPDDSERTHHTLSCADKGKSGKWKRDMLGYDDYPSFSLTCDGDTKNVTLDRGTHVSGSFGDKVLVRYGWSSWKYRIAAYEMHAEYWLYGGNRASVCRFGCRDSRPVDTIMDRFLDGMASEGYLVFSVGGNESGILYEWVPIGRGGARAVIDFRWRCGLYK